MDGSRRRFATRSTGSTSAVDAFFAEYRPRYLFVDAARVGGIQVSDALRANFRF